MKLTNKINPNLEADQILLDRTFLRVLKIYFEGKTLNELELSDDVKIFIEKFNEIDLGNKSIDFSIEEIYENLGSIFSNSENLGKFILFLDNYNINLELKSIFFKVLDYLLSSYKNKSNYANKLLYIFTHLKEKVENIINRNKFSNHIFQLKEYGFPIISHEGIFLDYLDLKDTIDLYGNGNPDEIYVKVKDMAGKTFYQNINGNILKTEEKILKDGENDLIFQHLTLNDLEGEKNIVFDKNFDRMTLIKLLELLNIGNKFTLKVLKNVLSTTGYNNIFLSKLDEIYNFYGVKFVKFSTDGFTGYEQKFIMRSDGLFLKDIYEEGSDIYIENLSNIVSIAGLEFVAFSFFDINSLKEELDIDIDSIDGFIDINGEIIFIKGEQLVKIEEIQFKDYFKMNDRDDLILSKAQLWEELKKYTSFNSQSNNLDKFIEIYQGQNIEVNETLDQDLEKICGNEETGFVLGFYENEEYFYNGVLLEKIVGKINEVGELDLYLKYSGILNKISYREIIDYFRENNKTRDVLKCLNLQISRISENN